MLINKIASNTKMCCKRKGSKFDCFAGFCHHCHATMSAHTRECCYSLFENRIISGLWTIGLCRIDVLVILLHIWFKVFKRGADLGYR